MSEHTPGPWWAAPSMFDVDTIYAPAQEDGSRDEVVAMGITNSADARLIAAAPEMYEKLVDCAEFLEERSMLKCEGCSEFAAELLTSVEAVIALAEGHKECEA